MKIQARAFVATAGYVLGCWLLATTLWFVATPSDALAQEPHQILYGPEPLDPVDFNGPTPSRLSVTVYELLDGTRAEWYRLEGWIKLRERVAFSMGLAYAGIQAESYTQYGGASPWVQMSAHFGPRGFLENAIDIHSYLPLGDATLYPVSAKAPSIAIRYRLALLAGPRWRVYVAWWARRVSPPSFENNVENRPESDFPSGSGFSLNGHGTSRYFGWSAAISYPTAGMPENTWFEGSLSWFPAPDFGVQGGGSINAGPDRAFDWAWNLGVIWRFNLPDEWRSGSANPGGK